MMFPPEIFGEIFSFLTSEASVLVACSQAHPIFAQLIEPTLYAHVMVHNHRANDDKHHLSFKPNQLSALLSDNPRIVNYLRSLCVDVFQFGSDDEASKELIAILPGLKLERIRLTHSYGTNDWRSFPITFRTAFVACISTSSMKEIYLDNISEFPLSSFADCAGLKRLTLFRMAVPLLDSSFNFPQLEVLKLSDWTMGGPCQDLFSWLLTHACRLRSLTLATYRDDVMCAFLPRLVAICSTSLVNLSIYYAKLTNSGGPIDFNFPDLPKLERLRLSMYSGSLLDSDHTVRALITFSRILKNLSSLQHFTLIIYHLFRGEDTEVDWSPLANFLSDQCSSFQHIDLYVRPLEADLEVSSDEVISMLSPYETLMNLVKAGCVSIKEEMDSDEDIRFLRKD